MSQTHVEYLNRCIQLAQRGGKAVKSNPQVGAVLVYNNIILGEGYHQEYGRSHAEVNAISSVPEEQKHLVNKSTLYVSLEPCNHQGKTGPCTQFIIKHNIPKVVIAAKDPNTTVVSDGIIKLKESGIDVKLIELDSALNLIRPFSLGSLKGIPYVILKFAQSKDHFIGNEGKQTWLSNKYSKQLTHKWRSEIDGIMVGSNTVITDNPKLTNRLFPGDSPIRIVLDRRQRITDDYHVKSGDHETWFYNEGDDLESLLKDLYKKGIHRLLVEGGRLLINSFIKANMWHEARIITTSNLLQEGIKAPVVKGKLISSQTLADDLIQVVYAA